MDFLHFFSMSYYFYVLKKKEVVFKGWRVLGIWVLRRRQLTLSSVSPALLSLLHSWGQTSRCSLCTRHSPVAAPVTHPSLHLHLGILLPSERQSEGREHRQPSWATGGREVAPHRWAECPSAITLLPCAPPLGSASFLVSFSWHPRCFCLLGFPVPRALRSSMWTWPWAQPQGIQKSFFFAFVFVVQDRVWPYSPDWPWTPGPSCLCLANSGVTGMTHHDQLPNCILLSEVNSTRYWRQN